MAFVRLDAQAADKIKAFLEEKGVTHPIRIDLQSTGCCDPSLGLCAGPVRDDDMSCESDGIEFLINPSVHQTVGHVNIAYSDDVASQGYVLTSSRPLSEWEGFGVCEIKIEPNV